MGRQRVKSERCLPQMVLTANRNAMRMQVPGESEQAVVIRHESKMLSHFPGIVRAEEEGTGRVGMKRVREKNCVFMYFQDEIFRQRFEILFLAGCKNSIRTFRFVKPDFVAGYSPPLLKSQLVPVRREIESCGGLRDLLEREKVVIPDDCIAARAFDCRYAGGRVACRIVGIAGCIVSDDVAKADDVVAISYLKLAKGFLERLNILVNVSDQTDSHHRLNPCKGKEVQKPGKSGI